ncbi:MAG: hypothetical protein HYV63_17740 [Candidatus Schekmanbacteria bacterium]|nr:hypothetical protein [Candidatus Schekmanbacteria bacterium]
MKSSLRLIVALSLATLAGQNAMAADYTAAGRLFYYDARSLSTRPLNQNNGAANITVEVREKTDGQAATKLATGLVGWDGRFSVPFSWASAADPRPDIYLSFQFKNSKWRVVNANGAIYTISSPVRWNNAAGPIGFGDMFVPRNTDYEKAMWVFQSMNEGWMYVESESGVDAGDQIRVQWPGKDDCPTSCASTSGIHITRARAGNTKNVIHEYGHMVNFHAWEILSFDFTGLGNDYCRTEGDDAASCGHDWNSLEWPYPAFKEGWANFVAYAALDCIGNNNCADVEDRRFNRNGEGNEGNVTAVLGDILDQHGDSHVNPDTGVQGRDNLDWNFRAMVGVLAHMSLIDILGEPDVTDYVDEIRDMYDGVNGPTWESMMNNSWIAY